MADWEQIRKLTHQVAPPDFASLARTARHRQRRARAAVGVLAALVLIGGGIGIATVGDPDPDRDPIQPAKDPTESPTDAPDSVLPLPGPDPGSTFATLDAGRYRVRLSDTLAFDVDVADRTSAHNDGLFLSNGPVVLKTEVAGEAYGVPRDPCTAHSIDPVGPTLDELVQALADLPVYQVSRPAPVELGGAEGTYLEARIPRTYDASQCDDRGSVRLPGNSSTAVGAKPPYLGRWWILDVDGQRVVVQQNCWGCTTAQLDHAATTPESITFTPTS